MLRCSDEIDGTRYLEADFCEECNTTAHTIHAIVSMAVMLVFSLGFPLSAGVVLWRRHRYGRLHDEDTRKQFLLLSEGAIACCVVLCVRVRTRARVCVCARARVCVCVCLWLAWSATSSQERNGGMSLSPLHFLSCGDPGACALLCAVCVRPRAFTLTCLPSYVRCLCCFVLCDSSCFAQGITTSGASGSQSSFAESS